MKRTLLFLLTIISLFLLPSCKKFIDQQKENYVLKIMTDGHWYVQTYSEAGLDYSYLFTGYEFQFYKNEKVDAINTLSSNATTGGTWQADVSTLNFSSNFTVATDPLQRLNHVWKITDSYTDAVFAEVSTPAGTVSILLRKK